MTKLLTRKNWALLSKAFRFLGFAGCLCIMLLWLILTGYYSASRPHVPESSHEWTVRLYWSFSPPSYGTPQENARLMLLHWWFFPFFLLIVVGEGIRIYKLENGKGDSIIDKKT